MDRNNFDIKLKQLFDENSLLVNRRNRVQQNGNGIYDRYEFPVLTRDHAPVFWQYDLNYETNPHLMMRLGINTTFNAGAIKFKGKYLMISRVEGFDVKSFFAVAESPNGIDRWKFRDRPIILPVDGDPEKNIDNIRLTQHEDGWIYGLFCTQNEEKCNPDDSFVPLASCGIVRTRDLVSWDRLQDLKVLPFQLRNCVLHPEYIKGTYMIYTVTQNSSPETGDPGICAGFSVSMENAAIEDLMIYPREYHNVNEVKYGQGPAPLKTPVGWLHMVHGVRSTSAGLRYTLNLFLADLNEPWKVVRRPGGHFIEPLGEECFGDVSNMTFSNGWILDSNGTVFIYYASSGTRMLVATTTLEKLIDYVLNTPEDSGRTQLDTWQRDNLILNNLKILKELYPGIRF